MLDRELGGKVECENLKGRGGVLIDVGGWRG